MSLEYKTVTFPAGSAVSEVVSLLNMKPVALISPAEWEGTASEGTVPFMEIEAADGAGDWVTVVDGTGSAYTVASLTPSSWITRDDIVFKSLRGDLRFTLRAEVDGTATDMEQTEAVSFYIAGEIE